MGALKGDEDPRNTLEHVPGHLEQWDEEGSPGRTLNELDEPSGEAHAQGNLHTYLEGSTDSISEVGGL